MRSSRPKFKIKLSPDFENRVSSSLSSPPTRSPITSVTSAPCHRLRSEQDVHIAQYAFGQNSFVGISRCLGRCTLSCFQVDLSLVSYPVLVHTVSERSVSLISQPAEHTRMERTVIQVQVDIILRNRALDLDPSPLQELLDVRVR